MDIRDFIQLLARSKTFIVVLIVSAMVTAMGLTYVISEKYQSSAVVLVQPQESLDLVPKRAEILKFPVGFNTPVETGSTTYSEIVKSRAIAEKIVAALRLDAKGNEGGAGIWRRALTGIKKDLMKAWTVMKFGRIPHDTPFNEAVEETIKNLSVKPTKDTYLFEIVAQARSPQRAADIANSATAAFTDYVRQVTAADNAATGKESLDKLTESSRTLELSRRALADYKRAHGITLLSKEAELELEALSGREKSLETTTTKIAGLSARREELRKKIAETSAVARFSSTVIDNPLLRDLRTKLTNNEMRLARLSEVYTDKHKEVAEIQAENARMEEELAKAPRTIDSEQVMQVNPLYQSLMTDLTAVENDLVSLGAERDKLAAEIDAKKAMLARIPSEEATVARLQLAVDLNEETQKLIAKENDEVNAGAVKAGPTLQVVHAAVPSVYPVSPIKIYNILLAAVLATLTAIAFVLARASLSRSEDAEQDAKARAANTPS